MFKFLTKKKEKTTIKNATITSALSAFVNSLFSSNISNSFALVPVYACIRIISQTIATSPLKFYRLNNNKREEFTSPLTQLLQAPYGSMTYYNFMNAIASNLAGRGNGFVYIERDIDNTILNLIPLKWENVVIMRDEVNNIIIYDINYRGITLSLFDYQVLHFKAFSEDGIIGINPIDLHKSTINSGLEEQNFKDVFYKQAVNISGMITTEKNLSVEALAQLKEQFGTNNAGASNAGKTAILPNGMSYQQLNMISPADANYIESAKLTRADIGVIFGVPLNKLGDLSQATYGNLNELNQDFYKSTISPYLTCIKQELEMKLLREDEKGIISIEFDTDILLRQSKKERYETYQIGIDNGFITRNEARESENLEPLEGLDEIMQKSGTLSSSQANSNFNKGSGNENN